MPASLSMFVLLPETLPPPPDSDNKLFPELKLSRWPPPRGRRGELKLSRRGREEEELKLSRREVEDELKLSRREGEGFLGMTLLSESYSPSSSKSPSSTSSSSSSEASLTSPRVDVPRASKAKAIFPAWGWVRFSFPYPRHHQKKRSNIPGLFHFHWLFIFSSWPSVSMRFSSWSIFSFSYLFYHLKALRLADACRTFHAFPLRFTLSSSLVLVYDDFAPSACFLQVLRPVTKSDKCGAFLRL